MNSAICFINQVQVRRLVRRGQLELALGGWVMPDEASSHYVAVIDQLIEGHQWLWSNLGVRPENSWSIDPFGYSSTMAYLWQKSGMSNMVVQRVHQAVKSSLVKDKALEFYWRQMWDDQGTTDIFCHVMPFMLYSLKYTCGPSQFVCLHFDFRNIPGEVSESLATEITEDTLEDRAEMLYQQYRLKANLFRYNTILVPLGDDFRYDLDQEWDQQYENYEKLMAYMNSRPDWNVHVRWGTLRDYFQLVKKEHTKRKLITKTNDFPILSGDFFPYSDKDMAYWTGYYTTRPFDKVFGRDVQSLIRAADILSSFHYAYHKKWNRKSDTRFSAYASLLQQARRWLGLFLHHDAITGTAKSFVAADYEQYLLRAFSQAQEVIASTLLSLLSGGEEHSVAFLPETVRKSHTELPEKQVLSVLAAGTTVAFFNPLGQHRQQIVHLFVDTHMLEVLSSTGEIIPSQVSPAWSRQKENVEAVLELAFLVEIGPFAVTCFILRRKDFQPASSFTSFVRFVNSDRHQVPAFLGSHQKTPGAMPTELIVVDNGVIQLTFDTRTGSLLQVMDLSTKNITKLNLRFQIYKSRGSGAYLFSPEGPATNLSSSAPTMKLSRGPMVTSVEVTFEPYITHTVTLYRLPSDMASSIFVENRINIADKVNTELIMKLNTDIQNSDLSYFTDQNGFQFIRRRTNKSQPTKANYYPMTTALVMQDHLSRLTLLSAQPHGVACLEIGEVEVMLDRHLFEDDGRGMGEGVTDVKTTVSRFVIKLEKRTSLAMPTESQFTSLSLASLGVQDKLEQPLLLYFTTGNVSNFLKNVEPFPHPLPCDLSAVNFRSLANSDMTYNGTSFILHRRGYDCSFPVTDLLCSPSEASLTFDTLFQEFNIRNIRETTLTHTAVKRKVAATDYVMAAPMEISAFHFQL